MQKIPLTLAKAGMVLARPVERDDAITVAAAGLELTDALIQRLENMKVERIVVEGNPVDLDGAGGGAIFSQRLERLDHLFRNYGSDPWMRKVKAFLHHYFKLKAAGVRTSEVEEVEDGQAGGEGAANGTADGTAKPAAKAAKKIVKKAAAKKGGRG